MTLAGLVLVAGVLFAADGMGEFSRFDHRSHAAAASVVPAQLEVHVTGPASKADVLIVEGSAIVYKSQAVPLPFTWTVTRSDPNAGVEVTASGHDGPSVACRIVAGGQTVSADQATGSIAHCGD